MIYQLYTCDHCYREERYINDDEADRDGWIRYQGLDFDEWDCLFEEFPEAPHERP